MHVDVVDAIEGEGLHPDIRVQAHEVGQDVFDVFLTLVRELGAPPGVAAVVLLHDELRGETHAEAVAHEVATGVHEVVGLGGGFVQIDAHVVGDDLRGHIVIRSRPVVQPVDNDAVVHTGAVHRVGPVVPNPDRVHRRVDDGDVVKACSRPAVVVGGQVGLDLVGALGQNQDVALFCRVDHDLLLDGAVAFPADAEDLDFLPLCHGAQALELGRGGLSAGHVRHVGIGLVELNLPGIDAVGEGGVEILGGGEDGQHQSGQQEAKGGGGFHRQGFGATR